MMKGTRSINTGFIKPYHITDKIETYNFRGVPEVILVIRILEFKLIKTESIYIFESLL